MRIFEFELDVLRVNTFNAYFNVALDLLASKDDNYQIIEISVYPQGGARVRYTFNPKED